MTQRIGRDGVLKDKLVGVVNMKLGTCINQQADDWSIGVRLEFSRQLPVGLWLKYDFDGPRHD